MVAATFGFATWLVSPRFGLDTPSLTDDWAAIAYSPDQLGDLARLTNPERQRFRPGWILWNYVQWHTFDAPRGLLGPNLWNLGRVLALIGGLTLLTVLALRTSGRSRGELLDVALAGVPSFLLLSVPWFAVDLARFGPQEPLLIGCMALGGSLLVLAARRFLDPTRRLGFAVAAPFIGGSGFWLIGVYQKEWSLAAIPLLIATCLAGRARLREWSRCDRRRRTLVIALAFVIVVPLAHVAAETLRIVLRGELAYGADVDAGRGIAHGLVALVDAAPSFLPPTAFIVFAGAFVSAALAIVRHRRVDPLVVGALVSGIAMLAFAAQSGVVASRYYMPTYALAAVSLALSLGALSRRSQLAGLAVVFLFLVAATPATLDRVRESMSEERSQDEVVQAISDYRLSDCEVAVAGLHEEAAAALPVLVALEPLRTGRRCARTGAYFVVGPLPEGKSLERACAPRSLSRLLASPGNMALLRCSRLGPSPVRDPELGRIDPARLVALRRLRIP